MKRFSFRCTPFDRFVYFLMAALVLVLQGAFVFLVLVIAPRSMERTFESLMDEFPIVLWMYVASWGVSIFSIYLCLANVVVRDQSRVIVSDEGVTLDRSGPPPFSGWRRKKRILIPQIESIDLAGISLTRPGKKKLRIRSARQKIDLYLDDLREINDDDEILLPYKGNWRNHPLVLTVRERMSAAVRQDHADQ